MPPAFFRLRIALLGRTVFSPVRTVTSLAETLSLAFLVDFFLATEVLLELEELDELDELDELMFN